MPRPWLLIDAPHLAYRAYYSTGGLTHNGKLTGVVFGFLRELSNLAERFDTDRVGFFFEGGKLHRSAVFPGYKLRTDTQERKEVKAQIKLLKDHVLPKLGFRNVFSYPGYEADDLIAQAVTQLCLNGRPLVIVSGDKDLLQLLHKPNVSVYDPKAKRSTTFDKFTKVMGISPAFWPRVKALVGCTTDSLPGLDGVGEATAIKFVNGTLPTHLVRYAQCRKAVADPDSVFHRNLKLVTLPYEGTPDMVFLKDELTREKWRAVCEEYGLRSLLHHLPVGGRTGELMTEVV